MSSTSSDDPDRARRGYVKLAVVAAGIGIVLGTLITFVERASLQGLRHHLTLWLVLAIVVIINLVSFVLFVAFYWLYRWVRQDLGPRES